MCLVANCDGSLTVGQVHLVEGCLGLEKAINWSSCCCAVREIGSSSSLFQVPWPNRDETGKMVSAEGI
jgi:hypothetical protein